MSTVLQIAKNLSVSIKKRLWHVAIIQGPARAWLGSSIGLHKHPYWYIRKRLESQNQPDRTAIFAFNLVCKFSYPAV